MLGESDEVEIQRARKAAGGLRVSDRRESEGGEGSAIKNSQSAPSSAANYPST